MSLFGNPFRDLGDGFYFQSSLHIGNGSLRAHTRAGLQAARTFLAVEARSRNGPAGLSGSRPRRRSHCFTCRLAQQFVKLWEAISVVRGVKTGDPKKYLLGSAVQTRNLHEPNNTQSRSKQVTLDLNGTSLHGPGGTNSAIGVLVPSRHSVTIQNGDIDGFGLAGIELLANSAQNIVDNVRLNANQTGVLAIIGTLNIVKNCVIDGGTVGILFSSGSGNRASNNTLGNQGPPTGIALLTLGSSQNYFENNLVFKGFNASGQVMAGGINDKYRFETFVGFPIVHPVSGGIEEFANSL